MSEKRDISAVMTPPKHHMSLDSLSLVLERTTKSKEVLFLCGDFDLANIEAMIEFFESLGFSVTVQTAPPLSVEDLKTYGLIILEGFGIPKKDWFHNLFLQYGKDLGIPVFYFYSCEAPPFPFVKSIDLPGKIGDIVDYLGEVYS
jgi:hypothetical protein